MPLHVQGSHLTWKGVSLQEWLRDIHGGQPTKGTHLILANHS